MTIATTDEEGRVTLWSTNFDDDMEVDFEVILGVLDENGNQSRMLARLHWFDVSAAERVMAWQSTWDGQRLPTNLKPYAWTSAPVPPDPAAITEGDD